jgi:4'-phosphopantetheinyl transferase
MSRGPAARPNGIGSPVRCVVWWLPTSSYHSVLVDVLSAEERARRASLWLDEDKIRFTLGAVLVRRVAERRLGVPVRVVRDCPTCRRPHGRPVIEGLPVHVSVSHSARWVVVAECAEAEIGVDVEWAAGSDDLRHLVRAVGHRGPALPEVDSDSRRALLATWTRKEAVVKATGDGLQVPLADIQLERLGSRRRVKNYPHREDLRNAQQVVDLTCPVDYVAALSVITRRDVETIAADGTELLACGTPGGCADPRSAGDA